MFAATLLSRIGRCIPLWIAGAVILLGNAIAAASCGDYLHGPHAIRNGNLPSESQLPDLPCHGPACRQVPNAPLPLPPVVLQASGVEMLLTLPVPIPVFSEGNNRSAGTIVFVAEDHRIGLDRPPRSRLLIGVAI